MGADGTTARTPNGTDEATAAGERRWTETFGVRGQALAEKVKELLHEGNVQRIVIKNQQGHTIIDIPVTAGVIVAVLAPVLTAVGAVAALASDWQIDVVRSDEHGSDS